MPSLPETAANPAQCAGALLAPAARAAVLLLIREAERLRKMDALSDREGKEPSAPESEAREESTHAPH